VAAVHIWHAGMTWREVERRALDWASRSLQREFELVIVADIVRDVR